MRPKGFDDYTVKLGDELRGERATRGKSLLDVQRDLRIKAAYIAAIENCDPSVFPNRGFVAGYVRSYARYLGLDSDDLFRRFCDESGFQGVSAELKPRSRKAKKAPINTSLKGAEISPVFEGAMMPHRESILSAVSPSGIASVAVLLGLIVGIGYGGWSVLKDIQRVEFAPVDQTPGVLAKIDDLDVPVSDVAPDIAAAKTEMATIDRDILGQLYRPQELEVPKVAPRDGPIAAIDPDTVGVFRPAPEPLPSIETRAASATSVEEFQGPVVTVDFKPKTVEVLAVRAAWVRVFEAGGTVLHEKILEQGERYSVPPEAVAPMLRAGNSGSVYLIIDGKAFGPVGRGTSVAKGISLLGDEVTDAFELALDLEIPADPTLNTAINTQ